MKNLIRYATLAVVILGALLCAGLVGEDGMAELPASPCDSDQIVLASTRAYPAAIGRTLDWRTFHGFQCEFNGRCTQTPVSLVDSDSFAATWIFVHGNQIPANEAIRRGVLIYTKLRNCCAAGGPIRFVIWSWPSQRVVGRIADAKLKAKRTDVESFYLASYLTRIAAENSVSLIGYSFGARITSGALHLASGGNLVGHCIPDHVPPKTPYRVAFLAAAVEHTAFSPGGRYYAGLRNVDDMLLLNNSRDKVLKFFWIIDPSRPKSMGSVGISCNPGATEVHQYNWANTIGKDHTIWRYLEQPAVIQRINATVSR